MKTYIPYKKLSKKEKRKIDLSRRGSWSGVNPVTRKPRSSKAYQRKRPLDWNKELPNPAAFGLVHKSSRNWMCFQFRELFSFQNKSSILSR